MDPAVSVGSNHGLEKRSVENGDEGELRVVKRRRRRCGPEEVKRVAEIVLVLSAMSGMRAGRGPTDAEVELMVEARGKLVEMCEEMAPRDIVAREAIGAVIEDLGLNGKLKDQRLGFRGPKMSISDKVSLAKRKMEESKKFSAPSASYTSHQSPASFGSVSENRGPSHTVRVIPSDKSTHVPASSGIFTTSSQHGHVSTPTSTSQPYQLPANEVKPTAVSSGLPINHLSRDSSSSAAPRAERQQLKLDAVSNGMPYSSQLQANSSANQPLVNAPTWSIQPQSALPAKSGPESKISNHTSGKVEGTDLSASLMAPHAVRDQTFRPFITQTAPGNLPSIHQPVQGMPFIQASSFGNNQTEISKIVQKILQPQLPEHPAWTPPSREYMNKAVTCQMCKLTINEVETALLCDACEKGYHLKCLQANNLKGIPRAEWHCMSCMMLSNGKPLPPKYGRVMRSINAPKMPNTIVAQSPLEKKVGSAEPKVNQQKITANGNSGVQSPAGSGSGTVGGNFAESASEPKIPNAGEIPGSGITSNRKDMEQGTSFGPSANNSVKSYGAVCALPSVGTSSEGCSQQIQMSQPATHEERSVSESKLHVPNMLSDAVSSKYDHSQPSSNSHDVVQTGLPTCSEAPLKTCQDNPKVESSRGASECSSRCDASQGEQDVAQANPVGTSGPSSVPSRNAGLSSDGLHNVEWVGSVIQVVDGKAFYQSCCVDGVTYKLQDHALFHFSHDKLIPSKLKAMWEDIKTGSKWVVATRCYFPGDLPEAVGRPCTPESNEVYESSRDSSVMAGLIQGPCEVLPPANFKEASERQRLSGTEANNGSSIIYLCRWFYDEFKGAFQPVFS